MPFWQPSSILRSVFIRSVFIRILLWQINIVVVVAISNDLELTLKIISGQVL